MLDAWGHLGPGTVRFLEELAEERGGRRRRRGAWATVEGAYGGDDAEDPTISWLAGWSKDGNLFKKLPKVNRIILINRIMRP